MNSVVVTADGKHFFTTASDGAIFMCKIQVGEGGGFDTPWKGVSGGGGQIELNWLVY